MVIKWYASVFYIVCYIAAFYSLFSVKKTEKELNGVQWIGITIIATICTQVLEAAILGVAHIPINLYSVGVCNLVVACVMLRFTKREKQMYQCEIYDFIVLVILIMCAMLFWKTQYGIELNIHYNTIDPAAHFTSAMDVVNSQKIQSMYYSALFNAILIQLLGPLFGASCYYKIFLLSDVINLFLAGFLFWCAIRRYTTDRFLKVIGVIATVVYLIGYPLNNAIFGFVYLGMGVTVIAYIIQISQLHLEDDIDKRVSIPFLMLGCLGIFESYVLFMPVVYFALFFAIAFVRMKEKRLISKSTIMEMLEIFLWPCVIGLLYTYMGIFGGETTVGGAISAEGAIYRDLYSNFLWVMPFALYGVAMAIIKRKQEILCYMFVLLGIFIIGLGYLGMEHKVSSYYYYKNYYFMWLIVMLLAVQAVSYVGKEGRLLITCILCTGLFIVGVYVSQFEIRIQQKNELYCPVAKSANYMDIFVYNNQAMKNPRYSLEKMELYQYVVNNLLQKKTGEIPLAGYWEDDYWYQAITNQRLVGYQYWNFGEEEFFRRLEESSSYVVVLYDGEIYQNQQDYFDKLEKVTENAAGYIAKVK